LQRDFNWASFRGEDYDDGREQFMLESDDSVDKVVNYIVDLKTHRITGETSGVHFGTRQYYNYRACIMAWSPDSRLFVELNTAKWLYTDCCLGCLGEGKLAALHDLGAAVAARAKEFLKSSHHAGFRRYGANMACALANPELHNDGTGSIDVTLQVPKSLDDDASASVRVRFRIAGGNRLEMPGATLLQEE
jgi:hypothetical protein